MLIAHPFAYGALVSIRRSGREDRYDFAHKTFVTFLVFSIDLIPTVACEPVLAVVLVEAAALSVRFCSQEEGSLRVVGCNRPSFNLYNPFYQQLRGSENDLCKDVLPYISSNSCSLTRPILGRGV